MGHPNINDYVFSNENIDALQWPGPSLEDVTFGIPAVDGSALHDGWDEFMQWDPVFPPDSESPSVQSSLAIDTASPPQSEGSQGASNDSTTISNRSSVPPFESPPSSGSKHRFAFGDAHESVHDFEFLHPSPTAAIFPVSSITMPVATLQPTVASGNSRPNPPDPTLRTKTRVSNTGPSNASTRDESISKTSNKHYSTPSVGSTPSTAPPLPPTAKKRKASTSDGSPEAQDDGLPPKKTAHNMIEKRYRNNLNDKIAALRDSVPSLRIMSRSGMGDGVDDPEDLEGLTPAHKLNKATVLSKATEYIHHLEKRSKRLTDERDSYKAKLEALEKVAMTGAPYSLSTGVSTPDTSHFPDESGIRGPTATAQTSQAPQGLIPVPQEMLNLHRANYQSSPFSNTQATSGTANTGQRRVPSAGRNRQSFGIGGKVMLGALSGIMILEGLVQEERGGDDPDGRGLFALPVSLLRRGLPHNSFHASDFHGYSGLNLLRTGTLIVALVYLLLPLLQFKRSNDRQKTPAAIPSRAPSLASPVEVRRKAFLTAVQTVWVPGQSFALECTALIAKTMQLSLRSLVGWKGFSMLTGVSQELEDARVKAWEVALDAQLTGGDELITWRRLLLTLLASWTLPVTPARSMLQALHTRLMLWDARVTGYQQLWLWLFDGYNKNEARNYWASAQQRSGELREAHNDQLPEHLKTLLAVDLDDVFVDEVLQRAHNLAWNKPPSFNLESNQDTDLVVEDFAISSPLDALASWWSSFMRRSIKIRSLSEGTDNVVIDGVDVAIRTAPPASRSHLRALIVKAVLVKVDRASSVTQAYEAMPSSISQTNGRQHAEDQPVLNVVRETPITTDIRIALTLAKAMALAEVGKDRSASTFARRRAVAAVEAFYPTGDLTLLSFVAMYKTLECFSVDTDLFTCARSGLERMTNTMRVWAGSEAGSRAGLTDEVRAITISKCLTWSKTLVGVRDPAQEVQASLDEEGESDAGYVSADSADDIAKSASQITKAKVVSVQ